MPTGNNLPGLFTDPSLRFKMELQRVWKRLRDFARYHPSKCQSLRLNTHRYDSVIAIKLMVKPWLKLRLLETASTAVGLHRQMYTAFAEYVDVFLCTEVAFSQWY